MLIIPDYSKIDESLKLAREYALGFEYNDFYLNLDDTAAIEEKISFYRRNLPPCGCTLHGAFYDVAIGSIDAQIRAVSRQRIEQSVEICKQLGARAVVFHTNTIANFRSQPYDGLSIGILASLKAVGYGKTADLPFPIITGQDCEVPSIKSIIAGEQTSSVFVDTRALAKVAVDLVAQALSGAEVVVNKPEAYDNGVKKVSAMAINAQIVDKDTYEAVLIDSGYYTADDLK